MVNNLTKIRVIYADTDAMGIVYHTNYIKWFEVGRNELMRQLGIAYKEMEELGFNLPLTKVSCHYFLPAKYDNVLTIETQIDYIKRASMKFNSYIWDEDKKTLLVEGYTVHACTNAEGKIRRIPPQILELLKKYNIKGE
ncbi:MAG: thioesterase family protein [Smithellaceae bacterium]